MAILVGYFLALDKDYAVRATLATQKSLELHANKGAFYLKVKVYHLKILTNHTIFSDSCSLN
jgi:hypothetical protein